MTDEPSTPAALPRNREADEWRARAVMYDRFAAVLLVMWMWSTLAWGGASSERDAARAALAAAEQRAQVAEERLRGPPIVLAGQNVRCGADGCGVLTMPLIGRSLRVGVNTTVTTGRNADIPVTITGGQP